MWLHGLLLAGCVVVIGGAAAAAPGNGQTAGAYWRFEEGTPGQAVTAAHDESRRLVAEAGTKAPVASGDVPMAVIPGTNAANHGSLHCDGGYLRVASTPELNEHRNFTVELWAKFAPLGGKAQVLASKGVQGPGNWHLLYQTDGTVQANIYGGTVTYFFDAAGGGPVPGVWYHLAATYQEADDAGTRITAYVNGQLRDTAVGPPLQNTSGTDLFIGSYPNGELPFRGWVDEFRFTPRVLAPDEFLIGGPQPIPEAARLPEPLFVPPDTRIDDGLRAKAAGRPILARPEGYPYFHLVSTGAAVHVGAPPEGYDAGFAGRREGWGVMKGGSPAGYHFAVRPGGRYLVAIGFYDPTTEPGQRQQYVVMDGVRVDTLDPAADGNRQPLVRLYEVEDRNGDGSLEVSCSHAVDEGGFTGLMNVIWVFGAEQRDDVNAEDLLHGRCPVPPMYYVRCGDEEPQRGHVAYPELSAEARGRMLPPRRVPFDLDPDWPQPADPANVHVRGELADRINTYLDRWGYAGRDQRLVAGFLSDSGVETASRYLDTLAKLSRLTRRDLELRVPFEALLERQDATSPFPGSFIGGSPVRTGFIWSQGTAFSALMEYHELTGDPRAMEAASRLADWYRSYLDNGDLAAANYFAADGRFSREGATVGQLGKGALEALLWLYYRTREPRFLAEAKEMADLNRRWGGVAWMIHGDIPNEKPEYEGWHIHANLTTVRGFPWLYAATGERSYLADAVAACDRVWERATWGTGGVLEQIPWGTNPDPHDETCQTSDELQLSYLLADFTGDTRFLDRAEHIYTNHIRYMQMHNGDFSTFNRLPGPQRGGDGWFCCGWWGAKALYEVARHLVASSPEAVTVNGLQPAEVVVPVGETMVRVGIEADIPRSGDVRLTVSPERPATFALMLRVPGGMVLEGVRVNGEAQHTEVRRGYARLQRHWERGDRVEVRFGLPQRVVLDSAWDTLAPAMVAVNGAPAVEGRTVMVMQGPAIMAAFRLAHGCDLNWAYTGDHPDLFETLDSAADVIEAEDWSFRSDGPPARTTVTQEPGGVRLQWEFVPHPGWVLRRSALLRPGVPVRVDFGAELVAPSAEAARTVRSARFCGVRMRTRGFVDYRPAELIVAGRRRQLAAEEVLPGGTATLDNGYVQFAVAAEGKGLAAANEGRYATVYALGEPRGNRVVATARLEVTGQSQWAGPVVGAEGGG